MEIEAKHIKRQTQAGHIKGIPVIHILTTGGLNIFTMMKGGIADVIACGPDVRSM